MTLFHAGHPDRNTAELAEALREIGEAALALQRRSDALVKGRRFRIVSDFNGQYCGGRSRPSLKGQTFDATGCFVDVDGRVCLQFALREEWHSIRSSEVEWLD